MLVLSILATVPSILAAPGVLIDAKSEYLSGQSATIICSVDNNNVHIGSLAWWRTGPSDVEEWVGNSLVQKGDDDLYTVTDTLYNSAISNANIDVRFYNETDSSQSTLTVENVETDYDNLFNYFCKVQFNDPERGMIADLKASDKESFAVFEQPSQPFFTRTDKMNGEATYVCQTTHAGVPMTDLDLRLQVVDTDSYGKKRLVEDIPTTLLEGNKVVRGTFKIKPKHATAIVQCIADHTSNNLDGAVELEPAQDFFKKLTPLAGPRRDVNVTVNGHLETKAALIYDPLAPMPRTADSIQFMEPIFNDPKIGEDGSCTVRFQVLIPDSINPQPARRWYVNDQLTQGAGNEFVYKVRKNEAADITFAAMSPLGDEHITTNVDQDCFPPPPPEVAQAPAGATGTLSIVIIIIIVIVIIVIAVIIAVMIKRKNESEEDEESGDKNDLDETAGSITYQPGNSRSEIQGGYQHEPLDDQLTDYTPPTPSTPTHQVVPVKYDPYQAKTGPDHLRTFKPRHLDIISEKSHDIRDHSASQASIRTDATAEDIPEFAPPSMPNENSLSEPMEDSLDIEIDRFMNFEGSKTLLAQKLNKRFS